MHVESHMAQIGRQAQESQHWFPVGSTEALRAQVPTPVQAHFAFGGTLDSQVKSGLSSLNPASQFYVKIFQN